MVSVYVVQHAQKQPTPGDPELTDLGHRQAEQVASALADRAIRRVVSSPLTRAVQTARPVAGALGVDLELDERLSERMNWDGSILIEQFMSEWIATTEDRSVVPTIGESSLAAGRRFARALDDYLSDGVDVALVTHGGVTVDGLRTMFGDAVVTDLHPTWREGVPASGITLVETRPLGRHLFGTSATSRVCAVRSLICVSESRRPWWWIRREPRSPTWRFGT